MGLELLTPPTDDLTLITLDDAKAHVRVDSSDDDQYLTTLISVGRQWAEEYTQRSILVTGWRYYRDSFISEILPARPSIYFESTYYSAPRRTNIYSSSSIIEIPRPVLNSVTEIKYYDTDNTEQTLVEDTDFLVNTTPDYLFGNVEPINNWPSTFNRKNAAWIDFNAGWTAADVPPDIRHAILILITELYEMRQDSITGTIISRSDVSRRLLDRYKVDQ